MSFGVRRSTSGNTWLSVMTRADDGHGTRVQEIPDHLLLWEDQAAFRGGFVDEDNDVQRVHEVFLTTVSGDKPRHAFFQVVDAESGLDTDIDFMSVHD